MQPATIDCIEEYRIMAITARNAPSDCLVFTVHSQTVLLISSDSDTIHYTNHSWLMNSIFVNCCLGVELDNERQNSADCMHPLINVLNPQSFT